MDAPHESISGYAPDWLLRRLAAAPEPFGEATAETGEAGVLFADISGFTALTERLAQRGGAGVETLIGILNRAFGALITQVYRHGGDILKFAGDALLAVWPAGADGLAEAVARAAECALGMPSLVSGLAVPGETPLSIRVGIGAGPIRLAYVGGLNGRWETLVTGEPLSGLKGAMAQACPGEVVLSPEACFHVGNRASVVPLSDGVVRLQAWRSGSREPVAVAPTVTQAMVPALQGLIPGAVLARLAAGQQRWTAELRTATVIFANLPGLTAGTPLGEAQAIALTLQRVLYRFEGSLNKLSVDEKGVSMVAAFGLPPLTHEDDAVRAVRAARDLQGALLELGVEASVGLATGRVFCGEVGNERRREYTLIGDVVNLAARLMAAAEGDPLIDEATAIAASSRARFEALPPVRLKGKAQPVKVFRLIEVGREPAEPIASLIGRQRERGVLEARLEALARHGEGGVVVIEAEAGVGKSRLVGHLLDRAREREVGWALGAGDAIDRSHAFHAWPQVFASWYGTDPVACRERVLASLDSADHSIVPILQPVLPMNLAETGVTAEMAGETRAANVRRLLGALMAKIARQAPQVVVIEDAHWLDSASWAVALEASRQAGILLVMTTRPLGEAAPLEYHQIVGSAGTRVLPLGAMDPARPGGWWPAASEWTCCPTTWPRSSSIGPRGTPTSAKSSPSPCARPT